MSDSTFQIVSRFGDTLRTLRQKHGLSQLELAKRAKVGQGAISEMEAGLRVPSLPTIAKIARALQMRPSELIE